MREPHSLSQRLIIARTRFGVFIEWSARSIALVVAIMAAVWNPAQVTAQQTLQVRNIDTTDIYEHAELIRQELELIRREMGRPKNVRDTIKVSNATLSDAYFMAVALFEKVDRLSFEVLREKGQLPEQQMEAINTTHVWRVLDDALSHLRDLKEYIGISEQASTGAAGEARTATDIVRSIIDANRQLNLVLSQPILPSDVFQSVTLASNYVAQLRAAFPGQRMPETPHYERHRCPSDVFRELYQCLEIVRSIEQQSGIRILQLQVNDNEIATVVPSDVLDLAALVVARVRSLHARLPGAAPARKPYYPGLKFPSHVHQRVRLLQSQLLELQTLARMRKDWLKIGGVPREPRPAGQS